MGRFFALTLEASQIIPVKSKPKRGHESGTDSSIWVVVLLVVFAIFYFVTVNSLSTKGYEIKTLERKIVELKEQQKRLELESASLQSIQTIQEAVKTLNLVPSKGVNYPAQNGYAYQNEDLN